MGEHTDFVNSSEPRIASAFHRGRRHSRVLCAKGTVLLVGPNAFCAVVMTLTLIQVAVGACVTIFASAIANGRVHKDGGRRKNWVAAFVRC